MELKTIKARLSERRAAFLSTAVIALESAVKAEYVANPMFVDAKDTFNRAAEEATEAFLKEGPKTGHHMGDWWLAAYEHNAFVSGASNIPTALKRAQKAGMKEYAAFLSALLPLHELLQAAKPLIVKRTPGVKQPPTTKQLQRLAATMTCQCCGNRYLANTGQIAHHGYERPGYGYQTASCIGARALPFEVSREKLGELIQTLKIHRGAMESNLTKAKREGFPLTLEYSDHSKPKIWNMHRGNVFETVRVDVTRKTFSKVAKEHADGFKRISHKDFDSVKAADIRDRQAKIKDISEYITASQARYDGWKQTHTGFDAKKEVWVAK